MELQHYGGKTTLIDFTQNIYIALFFACNGSFDENGRITLLSRSGIHLRKSKNCLNIGVHFSYL